MQCCPRSLSRKVLQAKDARRTKVALADEGGASRTDLPPGGNSVSGAVSYNPDSDYQRQSIVKKMSTVRSTIHKKNSRVSQIPGDPFSGKRQSVAVVECPIPNLCGDKTNRTSTSSRTSLFGGQRQSAPQRQSIAIPIARNISVSALEVCPASPEREKLIEIYCFTSHVLSHEASSKHLATFLREVERDATIICANPDGPLTETVKRTYKTTHEFDTQPKLVEHLATRKTFSIVGLRDGEHYLEDARLKLDDILRSHGENKFSLAVTDCSKLHNRNLIEDINEINLLVSSACHEIPAIKRPKGVPLIQLDDRHVAHISIGFDDYDQYEIRRTELLDYEKYLGELGLLEFVEEEEEDEEAVYE